MEEQQHSIHLVSCINAKHFESFISMLYKIGRLIITNGTKYTSTLNEMPTYHSPRINMVGMSICSFLSLVPSEKSFELSTYDCNVNTFLTSKGTHATLLRHKWPFRQLGKMRKTKTRLHLNSILFSRIIYV